MWSPVEAAESGGAPSSRGKHSATLLGGHVYILGGRGAGGAMPLRDFWRYCLADGKWERLSLSGSAPPALQQHSVVAHENKLYVFGGQVAPGTDTPLWLYHTVTGIWRKLSGPEPPAAPRRRVRTPPAPRAPRPRRGHSAHGLDDCMLLYGGYMDLKGTTNELWAFHYESESWQQVSARGTGPARHRHAAALLSHRLYVHGGLADLRECHDLWHYDTLSRVWTQVRTPRGSGPGPRSGHAGLRAGSHLYIYGGESNGVPTNQLWRFHFATETWQQVQHASSWPSPRVDACALLVPFTPRPAPRPPPARTRPDPPNLLRDVSRFSTFRRRNNRCSYTVLSTELDSNESLHNAIPKSLSAFVIDKRQPGDGHESPRHGDEADMPRDRISVPEFADMVLPTPVLSPVEATKLVYLDSEDEEEVKREIEMIKKQNMEKQASIDTGQTPDQTVVVIPKSASVRFTKEPTIFTTSDEGESSTSDYASAERVNRLSGVSLGFCNPHYLGPDVRKLTALTPDSGVAPGDIELQDMSEKSSRNVVRGGEQQLHMLLVGGKEPPHIALMQRPLSMWTYRLL